jgi:hypothetical protein
MVRLGLVIAACGFTASVAMASILAMETTSIIFEKDKRSAEGVIWTQNATLTDAGLVAMAGEMWVQTAKIPAGLAWRPPTAARVELSIQGETPKYATAYVRYGCDGMHWSTWQPLTRANNVVRGELRVPEVARRKYLELMDEWRQTDPVWSCDEDALCRWIAKQQPAFFEKELPFLGYLQFRIEDSSGQRPLTIARMETRAMWGVSGLQTIPRGPKPDYQKKWCFAP